MFNLRQTLIHLSNLLFLIFFKGLNEKFGLFSEVIMLKM